MKRDFITQKQSHDLGLITDIIKPIIGNISSIRSCMSEACNSYAYLVNDHFIVKNVLKHYKNLSNIDFNLEQILKGSMYRILYCLMRDIEENRPIEKGLETFRAKIYQ